MDRTIMLVEDNPDDVELNLHALRNFKLANRVLVFDDGVAATDWLFGRGEHAGRNTAETPAVILLDLKLPKLDGLEVLRQIRGDARTRLVPVIVLTSSHEERDVVASYNLGCNSCVRKPVDFAEFTKAVRDLGLYWLLLNEPPPPCDVPP